MGTLFNKYQAIEKFKDSVTEHKKKLDAFKDARKYHFISKATSSSALTRQGTSRKTPVFSFNIC